MALADIKALPVGHLARQDAIVLLWSTGAMLPQALDVLTAWGVKYLSQIIWRKVTKNGKLRFGRSTFGMAQESLRWRREPTCSATMTRWHMSETLTTNSGQARFGQSENQAAAWRGDFARRRRLLAPGLAEPA
jgi:hypothetical protein